MSEWQEFLDEQLKDPEVRSEWDALELELIKAMISSDDILTDEDIADVQQARAEFSRSEYVKHEEISWDKLELNQSANNSAALLPKGDSI
ncbi:MAG: hypothetical protein FWG14_09355 [Peptococcaceae bacterium]|nr:hypothetical protein [Peptococcaceae bacterium]